MAPPQAPLALERLGHISFRTLSRFHNRDIQARSGPEDTQVGTVSAAFRALPPATLALAGLLGIFTVLAWLFVAQENLGPILQ